MHETGLLDLQEVADHAHPATMWCSVEQAMIDGTVDQWPAHLRSCELVFKPKADILSIRCDYQFVFSVLDELHVSHHA